MIGCSNGKWSLNKICRLCLRHEGAMSSIFTEDTDGIIPRRILYCLSLKVFMNDGLPMLICAQCIYQLNCSFKFKTQCENSDAALRKYLSNNAQLKNEIKKEFQDETSGYDNTINCSDWDEKDEDHFTLCSVAAPKQLCLTGSLNQQQANIKLENDDELPYSHDSAWNCNESNTEVSPSVNQYGTSDEEEQRIGGNMIGDNIQVTSAKNTSQNEAEERSRGNIRKGFPHNGTAISVFKNMVISYKEPQENMKEQKRTLKSNFSTGNICVNRVRNKTVTSEMNQNPKKQYTCHLCFQSYAGRSGLWQHLQKHSGRQYVCKVCNKHFTRGNILKQHERSHSKDSSNNTCPICKKTFLNEMQRKRHEIGHFIDWSNAKICT